MSSKSEKKNCLIISYGPVPTPEYQTVEGGGMRAWGLAKGLLANGIETTIGVNDSFKQNISVHEGVNLLNWSLDQSFIDLLNSYDSVLISYCMGDPSVFVAENIKPTVQLILDVYVPIYIEVSARDSNNLPSEYAGYYQDIKRHNKVLSRGDYFLCTNEVQKIFYNGVLSSLGIVNPLSYRQNRIKIVPFGIHDTIDKAKSDPYFSLGITKHQKRVLWFGGLYPWFRIEELLDAIKNLSEQDSDIKFVFVGGKNPFNNNPDLLRQYEAAVKYSKDNKLINKSMFFVDWVEYDKRINWYQNSDFVISINQPGDENIFSWRTRVMDYIWGEMVSLTNGGDPLGEELLANGAAIKLDSLNSKVISKAIIEIYEDKDVLGKCKKSLKKIKSKYIWDNITKDLSELIREHSLMFSAEQDFILTNKINLVDPFAITNKPAGNQASSKVATIGKVVSYARSKGLRRSVSLGSTILKNQIKRKTLKPRQFIFISHPIDNTGAPVVLLQIVNEVLEKFGPRNIRIIAPYVDKVILKDLRMKGITVEKAAVMNYGLSAAQLSISKDDFVLMNTVAIYDNYREVVLNMLSVGRLKKATWFIHEDEAQLKVVRPVIQTSKSIKKKVSGLANTDKLEILVPSLRVKKYYDSIFNTSKVSAIPLRVDLGSIKQKQRLSSDYKKINFLISGTASDGRKGQLIALSAFQNFKLKYYDKNPEKYRDFSLHLVAIGSDYISSQIKTIGKATLGDKLKLYESLPRDKALEVTEACNAVICCSLNETFGLYVAEGMLLGHIVLRNNSAGIDEQLKDGENGYYLDSDDVNQFATVLEKTLNKKTCSDSFLHSMGKTSQDMMKEYKDNIYLDHINIKTIRGNHNE